MVETTSNNNIQLGEDTILTIEQSNEEINRLKTNILFLGMGMPQKEYFISDYFNRLDVQFCIAVGGAFDVWAGIKKRTPPLIDPGRQWLMAQIDLDEGLSEKKSSYTCSFDSFLLKSGAVTLSQ